MDFLPKTRYEPSTWKDDITTVNGFYGPGALMSWFLTGVSMLYDANKEPDSFHYFKYFAVISTGLAALADTIWRALHTDFGPSYAAALYMSDKAFELATLLYCIRYFPIRSGRTRDGNLAVDIEAEPRRRGNPSSVLPPLSPLPIIPRKEIPIGSFCVHNQD